MAGYEMEMRTHSSSKNGELLIKPETDSSLPAEVDQDDSETYRLLKKLRDCAFEGRKCRNVKNIAFIRDGSLRRALRDILLEHCPDSASSAVAVTTAENTVASRGSREPLQEQLTYIVSGQSETLNPTNSPFALNTEFHEMILTKIKKIQIWLNLNISDPEIAGVIDCLIRKVLQKSELAQLGCLPFPEFDATMGAMTEQVRDRLGKYGLTF